VPRSKTRSAKQATSAAPRKDARFFVDRSIGRHIVPAALRDAGFPTTAHDEVFDNPTTSDEVWLETAGNKGWLVVSRDKRIRRKANELDALKRHRVRAVFISGKNLTGKEMGELLVRCGRKIQDTLMSSKAPAAFSLTRDGKLTKIVL